MLIVVLKNGNKFCIVFIKLNADSTLQSKLSRCVYNLASASEEIAEWKALILVKYFT